MHERLNGSVAARLTEIVRNSLLGRSVTLEVGLDDDLREVLTSMEMVNLMLTTELEFALKIPARNMTPAHFRTIATIDALVASLVAAA